MFGPSIEANGVVVNPLRTGDALAWPGEEPTPLLIPGAVFGLMKYSYVRTPVTFYTIGTPGADNAMVIY